MTGAVVVAAGSGVRFGSGPPKQFRDLEGRPVLAWACEALRSHPRIDRVAVVLAPDAARSPPVWLSALTDVVTTGGATRRESVGRGVAALGDEMERILVHDGVRPFVSAALIERVWQAAGSGAVVPVLPVTETVKEVEEGSVVRTLPRRRLVRVQTPQGFPAGLLRRMHGEAEGAGEDAPDDAALCEARGIPVRTVEGDPQNLKITTASDLEYAAWLARSGLVAGGRCATRG